LRPRVKRLGKDGVGDVVAEGGKPELACLELNVGGAEQAARSVDDADGGESTELVSSAADLVSNDRALVLGGAGPISATSAPT